MTTALIFIPILTFFAVSGLICVVGKLALRCGFVDEPGGRKDHEDLVPPVGGLVIFPVFMVALLVAGGNIGALWPLYAALAILLVVGAWDDRGDVNAWLKFMSQFVAAALIVVPGHAQLENLGYLFGDDVFDLGFMSIPFSIIATVLLINAVNLMDGLDGLAGGKSFVALGWMAIACILAGQVGIALPVAIMLGALAGFLVFNMRHPLRDRASVFLGDAGSMGLGLMLAWFSIGLAQGDDPVLVPISVAWILALPIFDTCGQFFRRVREGRHPFSPDRGHFHHHLVHAGLTVGQATSVILLIGVVLGAVGYGGVVLGVPQWLLTVLWIACLFSHMALSQKPENYIALVRKVLRR